MDAGASDGVARGGGPGRDERSFDSGADDVGADQSGTLGFGGFRARHPDGLVMAEPEGFDRPYGTNPYENYDTGLPFLYNGPSPPHGYHALARVVRVGSRAWPLLRLRNAGRLEEAGLDAMEAAWRAAAEAERSPDAGPAA